MEKMYNDLPSYQAIIADDCDGMVNCEEIKSMARMAIKFINLNDKCCKISDVSYVDGYEDIIIKAFKKNPDAYIILFMFIDSILVSIGFHITIF